MWRAEKTLDWTPRHVVPQVEPSSVVQSSFADRLLASFGPQGLCRQSDWWRGGRRVAAGFFGVV